MKSSIFVFMLLLLSLGACRSDFKFEPSTGELGFSKDTIYLDTVFTNIGSSTYTLKVYNKSNKNITIPSVKLAQGEASNYRLMVDGVPGKVFSNVEILAKDSMFVFVETTINYEDFANTNTTFLYTDKIEFDSGSNYQSVELVTLVQDAVFIYPNRDADNVYENVILGVDENNEPITVRGSNLSANDPINGNELHWTNEKPYVIYGYAKVPENQTLQVDAGARIHFHDNSGLIVPNGASMQVNGQLSTSENLENEVIFEGDRLEPNYADVPGQWGTIWFLQGSTNSYFHYATIKNATVGVLITDNNPTNSSLQIENTQIYNCSNLGILARNANLTATNLVVNNCGQASVACTFGGSYEFTHCTIANYWSAPTQTALLITNYLETEDAIYVADLVKADFKNCIIYSSNNLGFLIDKEETSGAFLDFKFENTLLKFNDYNNQFITNPNYQFTNNLLYTSCVIATNNTTNKPDFLDARNNKLNIGDDSAAKDLGNFSFSATPDILGNTRDNPSDSGAYNSVVFD